MQYFFHLSPLLHNIMTFRQDESEFLMYSVRTHLEPTKDIYMYTSLLIDNKFALTLFYIVNDMQARRGEGTPS